MRTLAAALVLSALCSGGDVSEARRLLASKRVDDRVRGIRLLAKIDSAASIQALERAIKRASRDLDRVSKSIDRKNKAWSKLSLEATLIRIRRLLGESLSNKDRRILAWEAELRRELDELQEQGRLHLFIVTHACESLLSFRSAGAIAQIESGARNEPNTLLRLGYILGLGHASRKGSMPTLLELLDHKDPRLRAAAARALVPFGGEPAVTERLAALAGDPSWTVRLGAYQAMLSAPYAVAVELLVRAAATETGEMALVVDSYLEELTGESFAQRTDHWRFWWGKHAEAVRAGTFVPRFARPDSGERRTFATFFSIPIESERVVFVLDYSGSMSEELPANDARAQRVTRKYETPMTRLGYAKAEFIHALSALPDGALFNVYGYRSKLKAFAPRLVRLNASTRRRAIFWARRLKTDDLTNIFVGLQKGFRDYLAAGGARRFEDLPDTLVFLTDGRATTGRFQESGALRSMARLWNRSVNLVIHCVGIGGDHDRTLLAGLAKDSGGHYVDVRKGLRELKPRRRSLPAGVELVPLARGRFKALLSLLESPSLTLRVAAARKLARCGPRAAGAARALARALVAEQEELRQAAREALRAIGATAVDGLLAGVGAEETGEQIACVTALGVLGGAARRALPALEKLAQADDLSVAEAAREALRRIGSR